MSELLAYCAGLIDGEGWIGITTSQCRGRRYHRPIIQVSMTRSEPLEALSEALGGYRWVAKSRTISGGFVYSWAASAKGACEAIKKILPYLRLKTKQAEVALLLGRLKLRNCHRGLNEEELANRRWLHDIMRRLNQRGLATRG